MKITNQAIFCLAVILASVSVLASCGKKKNNTPVTATTNNSTYNPTPYYPAPGPGTPYPPPANTVATFSATGGMVISNASSAVWGDLQSSGAAINALSMYYLKNSSTSGDQIVLSISGVPQYGVGYTSISAAAIVYMGQSTYSFFQTVCGQAPTRIRFTNTVLVAGTPGTISAASPRLEAPNGCGMIL